MQEGLADARETVRGYKAARCNDHGESMAASMSATRLLHVLVLASCAIALQPTTKLVVVKYGGHCMTDEAATSSSRMRGRVAGGVQGIPSSSGATTADDGGEPLR